MKKMFHVCVVVAATAVGAGEARAQSGPWSLSFDLGSQIAVSGDVHGGGSGRVLNLPTEVEARTYDEVYGTGFYWAAGLGYRLGTSGEFRVQGSYTSNPAERLQVGNVAGLPLLALFDDYQAFGMDFGYRQYLGSAKARPFIGASAGFVNVQEIKAEFSVPAANVVLSDVDFLESSTVPSFGVGGGVQINLTDRFAIQGGVEFKWHGNLGDVDGLAGTGLETINDETSRWSMPITGGITIRF